MEREPIVQRVATPCEAIRRRAHALLHDVDGEFEDEDGDTANGFILADPIPLSFMRGFSLGYVQPPSLESRGSESSFRKKPKVGEQRQVIVVEDEDEENGGWFTCSLCKKEVLLQGLALPTLTCSCLFCKPCLESYAASLVSSGSNDEQPGPSSRSAVRAKNCSEALKYSRTSSSKFVDLTESSSGSSSSFECIPCPASACGGHFPVTELQSLAPKSFSEWEAAASEAFLHGNASFVKCPGCHVMIEKVKGELPPGLAPSGVPEVDRTLPFTELDRDGKPLSRAAMLHKAVNRFRCVLCNLEFCGACLESPYHLGNTCEEHRQELQAVKCVYCNKAVKEEEVQVIPRTVKQLRSELEHEGLDTAWCVEKSELVGVQELNSRVCREEECRKHLKEACTRVLHCGHRCGGVRGERNCLPCLEEGCGSSIQPETATGAPLPSGDELCGICLVEEIRAAPAVQVRCGHIVHLHCVKRQIEEGFPGPQITFGHLKCPQCKELLQHPRLEACMRKPLEMMEQIKAKAMKRMEMEGVRPDPSSKEATLALENYQFYICSKCEAPYYGGKRNCQAANQDQRRAYNPSELVCGGCIAGPVGKCKRGHGSEYVEFKCRFCCSPATFFCFGTTHFCNSCHVRRPDYKGRGNFAACNGPGKCPLGAKHAPNGTECCLGCSMCRAQEQ